MIRMHLRIFLMAVCWHASWQVSECGLYGASSCTYVPSPAGVTPACASPGRTYCETTKNYPTHLIQHLIHKWGYEAKDLIVDESKDDFEATRFAKTNSFFSTPQYAHLNALQFDGDGYDYSKPKRPAKAYSGPYVTNSKPLYIKQMKRRPDYYLIKENNHESHESYVKWPSRKPKIYVTEYDPVHWLKRLTRDLSVQQSKRILSFEDFDFGRAANDTSEAPAVDGDKDNDVEANEQDLYQLMSARKLRVKRQSSERQSLCQTNSLFITPKAALNTRGNWRYVVNMGDSSRQLVRVETCASNVCSNLCQLPNGYKSRCEQKFIQKRLIALNGDGQSLYTDTFWFPSCCACTIST